MRNVFVSYSHRLDQSDADEFRKRFGNTCYPEQIAFSDKSLQNRDLGYLSDDTIKDIYIRPKIRASSVTIVLIGEETGGRWWVDWEIYYSMLKTVNNDRNGIIGILLPNKKHNIPERILRNREYCSLINMPLTIYELEKYIEEAYNRKFEIEPDFSMPLRRRNS